ncbi:hypothetical protein AN644_02840 [Candidatus Epulonipiscium fishelsonii]|nr:hypothetical protein AN644_02840 [Epulopiscium sp. SCG-C06WGA-EpuloA1]
MNLKEKFFLGKEDTKIFYLQDIPSNAKAIIIIAHGYMEHSGHYIDFASKLVEKNYGVCILDWRGNGKSEGEHGDINDFFLYVEDLKYLITNLNKYKKLIITYGHSMGGLITFLYGLIYPKDIKGQIFASPALGFPPLCKYIPKNIFQKIGRTVPVIKFKKLPFGINLAVKNKKFADKFAKDTLSNKFGTARFFDQFLRCGIEYAQDHAYQYEINSLFLLGTSDYVIPIKNTLTTLNKIPDFNKKVIVYKDCMHDLLHDEEYTINKILKDIFKWLKFITKEH